jgi:hypothetical protein
MSEAEAGNNWILGAVLGLAGSIAINTGNNLQSLGFNQLKQDKIYPPVEADPDQHDQETSTQASIGEQNTNSICPESPNSDHVRESSNDGDGDGASDGNKENDGNERSSGREVNVNVHVVVQQMERKPTESKIWIIGTVIFVAGTILNFYSYSFAAQSMLASLESVQFLTNLLFGKYLLGEIVTKQMMVGTGLAIVGTMIAVQFSSKETLDLNTEEIKALYGNTAFLVYVGVAVFLLIALDQSYRRYERQHRQGNPFKHSQMIMAVQYSVWSALIGTQSVVQAKVIAELLTVQARALENVFASWFTYVTIVLWLVTAAIWIQRLQNALTKFSPIFIIPLLQSNFIFLAIISGGIFFQEFNSFTAGQWVGFWFGVLVMSAGLALLVLSKNEELPPKGDDITVSLVPVDPTDSCDTNANEDTPPRHSEPAGDVEQAGSRRDASADAQQQAGINDSGDNGTEVQLS